jgi:(S)-2-hydroxyglutarate dehydrogenase
METADSPRLVLGGLSSTIWPVRFTIIGAGLVGLATGLELQRRWPRGEVRLLEKESQVGLHQSTHNSGVLHAGLYYRPGSLKAKLAVSGIRRMVEFCEENGVAHEICGKVVVATDEPEVGRLRNLFARGEQNGLRGLRWLTPPELREIEPHAVGLAAVQVPEEGIVDFRQVCGAMRRRLEEGGGGVTTSAELMRARPEGRSWRVETTVGEFSTDFLINCAGLHCDRVAQACGEGRTTRILPFRGEYYELQPSARHLVRNLIYPVPDPALPFLGVHFTRLIGGGIEAGPNAVLALAREGYTKWKLNPKDVIDAVAFRGFWNFIRRHPATTWAEICRSMSRRLFCASLQRLVPAVQESDLARGGAGVRAQAIQPDGTLVQDFEFLERSNALHVLNAPSPAATASLAIGDFIAGKALRLAGLSSTSREGEI